MRVYPASAVDPDADAATASHGRGLGGAHGGGLVAGDREKPAADWVARTLADRGVTVVSVDYRLAGDGCRYPAPSDDVLAAWRWTLANADRLGIDPARLAIGGASAGANLVAGAVLRLLAAHDHHDSAGGAPAADATLDIASDSRAPSAAPTPLPAGVFLAYPTLLAVQPAPDAALRALLDSNPDADHFGPDAVRSMYEQDLGGPVDDAPLPVVPGEAAASDLAGFPPVLMINGEADELRVSGEVFATSLVAAGVPLELVVEPGTLHGHLNRPDEPAASASIDRVVRWIARLAAHQATLRITEGITP